MTEPVNKTTVRLSDDALAVLRHPYDASCYPKSVVSRLVRLKLLERCSGDYFVTAAGKELRDAE